MTPRSRNVARAGLGRAPPVDHDGGHTGAGRGLEGGVPAVVDLHQVDQRADDAVDVAQQLAPAGALQISASARSSASARAAVRWRASSRVVGRPLGRLGALRVGLLELGASAPPSSASRRGRRRPRARRPRRPSRSARTAAAGVALLERGAPARSSAVRSCCSRPSARAERARCGPAPGPCACVRASSAARAPRPSARRSAASSASRAASAASSSARSGAPPASSSASAAASSLARRAASASRVETTSTSAAASRAATTPRLRSRRTPEVPTGPLDQPLHPAQGVGQVLLAARRQLGRGGGRLGVERLEGLVQLALLVAADGQVLGRRPAPGRQLGQLGAGEVAAHGQQLGGHACRASGPPRPGARGAGSGAAPRAPGRPGARGSRPCAASRRSARSRRRRCLSTPAASSMMARRSSGRALSTVSSWPWPMIMCCWRPTPESREQLLDVEQPAGRAVDGVLAVARAEQRPGDGDLGQVDGQLARRVVDGERDLGPARAGDARRSRRR